MLYMLMLRDPHRSTLEWPRELKFSFAFSCLLRRFFVFLFSLYHVLVLLLSPAFMSAALFCSALFVSALVFYALHGASGIGIFSNMLFWDRLLFKKHD
jgi:hypothetical protein